MKSHQFAAACLLPLLFLRPAALRAEVKPNALFSEHAVLQREAELPVWGTGREGESVTVSFAGQSVSAVTKNGEWMVHLKPLHASSTPQTMTIKGDNTITLGDLLVGDVWLCSGQSNMGFQLNAVENAAAEIAAANLPLVRHFRVKNVSAPAPLKTMDGQWQVATPENAPTFSAVAFLFAKDLQPAIGVPLGVVNSSWGGTSATAWESAEALATDPTKPSILEKWAKAMEAYPAAKAKYDADLAAWQQAAAAAKTAGTPFTTKKPNPPSGPGDRNTPNGLFNGMIHPMLDYPFKGVVWYQGEQDASKHAGYHYWFPALIKQWRQDFHQPELPFLYVQLPNHNSEGAYSTSWAFMRGVQAEALALPKTGMAVTIDVGEDTNVHPKKKQPVAQRLALIAEALVYGKPVKYEGPIFGSATVEGAAMVIHFKRGAEGLTMKGDALKEFQLAGADRQFKPAQAKIEGETLRVTSPEVPAPVAVRYAWRNGSEANLYNGAGLPASPFRSDDWEH